MEPLESELEKLASNIKELETQGEELGKIKQRES